MSKNNKKEDAVRKNFHKGMKVSFWGRSYRIGTITKMFENIGVIIHNNEVWHVPYTCMKKV